VPDNNQTMDALRNYFKDAGTMQATHVQPFSSKTKYSSVMTLEREYRLGAPDFLLEGPLINRYEEQISEFEEQGLRVLSFIAIEGGVIRPLAFITIENHIRADAIDTFRYFREQDVEIKVISGDNPLTVSKIAERAGIENSDCYINAMELDTQEKIADAVKKYTVFGRVTPEQKKMIIDSLKEQGNTVAMTGDGVNDILAMKDADCSIAMGSGSEAAMQAAQVVLLDSDFSHMTNIVSEGRKDINNIERSATLFLVKNIFSVLLGIFSVIWLDMYPLKPAQISLISGFNIGVPAFLLALESNTKRQGKHFLKRILLKALPAALTAFVVIAAMAKFGEEFKFNIDDISVSSTYLFAIVGFMILIFISRPMNRYRYGVLVVCVIGLLLTSVFFRNLFSITPISKQCFMLLVIFAICTEPFFRYLTWLAERIDQAFYKRKEKREIRREMRHKIRKIDEARQDGEF
jgi:cation-transporting ATPase E